MSDVLVEVVAVVLPGEWD